MLVIQELLVDRLAAPAEERERRGREFGAWVGELRESGVLVGGHQLTADGGRIVSIGGVEDRASSVLTGEVASRILLITVDDEVRAVLIAQACPILKYGGRVAVRRVRSG